MQRSIFLSLFLISSFVGSVKGQTIEQTLILANQFYSRAEYYDAISAYRRALFFNKNQAPQLYFNLGECYLQTNEFEKSLYYFGLAENAASNDSVRLEAAFRKIAVQIINNKILFAKNDLFGLPNVESVYFKRKLAFYSGIIDIKESRIEEAMNHFIYLFPDANKEELKKFFKKAERRIQKKPQLAMAFSIAIPGLGQAYAGDWRDAGNSFTVNMLTTSLYVYVLYQYSLLDAVLAVLPWWHRYYLGGFQNARKKVIQNNEINKNESLKELLNWYSNTNLQ